MKFAPAQAGWLDDGRRLHMHHGPIDIILDAQGPGARQAYHNAFERFSTILEELVDEVSHLRAPASQQYPFKGSVARAMSKAVKAHLPAFITPMAAVAGAVADAILNAAIRKDDITKLSVNNGGDIAFYLTPGETMTAMIAGSGGGRLLVNHNQPWRGIATSGWRGRSHSLGIADAVTVVARTAAQADAAATMLANAVDIPGHASIQRQPANRLSPDSDLGERLVTTHVGKLTEKEIMRALSQGHELAYQLVTNGHIGGAMMCLQGHIITTEEFSASLIGAHKKETCP